MSAGSVRGSVPSVDLRLVTRVTLTSLNPVWESGSAMMNQLSASLLVVMQKLFGDGRSLRWVPPRQLPLFKRVGKLQENRCRKVFKSFRPSYAQGRA